MWAKIGKMLLTSVGIPLIQKGATWAYKSISDWIDRIQYRKKVKAKANEYKDSNTENGSRDGFNKLP